MATDWSWEVVSSYSSATAPGLHGISRADPLFQARKELNRQLSIRAFRLKTNLMSRAIMATVAAASPNFIVTGGAGFIGSNLTLALQEKFPDARLTVVDDFRSGDFKNLRGYRGDFVAQNLSLGSLATSPPDVFGTFAGSQVAAPDCQRTLNWSRTYWLR